MSIGKSSLARAAAAANAAPVSAEEKHTTDTVIAVPVSEIRLSKGARWPLASEKLIRSITANGIAEPVLLARTGETTFVLLAGARRVSAARTLELETVPAIVRDMTPAAAQALAVELRQFTGPAPETEPATVADDKPVKVGQDMPNWLL